MKRVEAEQRRQLAQVVSDKMQEVNEACEAKDRDANKRAFCDIVAVLTAMNEFCTPSWRYERKDGFYYIHAIRLKGLVF